MEDDDYSVSEVGHVDVRYRGWSEVETSVWDLRDKVKTLDLSYNNLNSLPEDIRLLRRLFELNCEINQISHIHNNIGKLRVLKVLKLSSNKLTEIPEVIGNCCNLKELYLDNNQIEVLPKSIGTCINLEILQLQNNVLKDLPITMANLSDSMQKIDVSNNPDLAIIPEKVQGDTQGIMWIVNLRHNRTNELRLIRQAIHDMGEIVKENDERIQAAKKSIKELDKRKRDLINEREEVWLYLKLRRIYRIFSRRATEKLHMIKTALRKTKISA